MTEARIEAVARAVDPYLWSELDKPKGTRYYHPACIDDVDYDSRRKSSLLRAKNAIEANDAWFQTHGWKAVPREHPRGGDRLDLAQAIMADQEMRTWQRLYDLAPSPEEVDR